MTPSGNNRLVAVDGLHAFVRRALERVGVSATHADVTADVLATTDSWGVHTHGTKLLAGYVRRLQAGGLRTDVEPCATSSGSAWAMVDGGSALGQVASVFAMEQAIAKARVAGVSYVGVRNSCHFGAAGYYAWLAAREGMIGLAMANDVPSVAAPGSRGAVLGSNPIAYAIPAGRHWPILLDMSIATVAGGKVYARCRLGEPIPPGWLVGPDGLPTQDGSLYPGQASLAPMGGHKGYGIGLLIESLSGVLSGASVTHAVGSWLFGDLAQATDHGGAFLVIDVEQILGGNAFRSRIDALIDEIHAAPTADGCTGIEVPGEREWRSRQRALAAGIDLPEDVRYVLRELCATLEIADPFTEPTACSA